MSLQAIGKWAGAGSGFLPLYAGGSVAKSGFAFKEKAKRGNISPLEIPEHILYPQWSLSHLTLGEGSGMKAGFFGGEKKAWRTRGYSRFLPTHEKGKLQSHGSFWRIIFAR